MGGIVENRGGRRWGALVPVVVVPVLARAAPREFDRLVEQARQRPRWWNRRLQPGTGAVVPAGPPTTGS